MILGATMNEQGNLKAHIKRTSTELMDYVNLLTAGDARWFAASDPERYPNEIYAFRAKQILRDRRAREHLFPSDLFADPAWDIMLDLFAARIEQKAISVSSACIASAAPPTTALRYIRRLVNAGIIDEIPDKADRRRVYVRLTEQAFENMQRWIRGG